ncbi:MAG: aldehyde dehydrogenase family protein, partial [Parachlamydiaceae bacterium]
LAETGGKNAMIITNLSDHDLVIKNLLTSAFGHSGQKCSACSLAILEAELYDDLHFRNQLRDAAQSLFVGSAWDLRSKMIPLIRAPQSGSPLYRALTQLEPHEEWLLQPKQDPDNPNLWSPGIKIGVKRNSFTHQTEFFGPVLGIMRATSLSEAIELANGTRYGLTAGLHSLDDREKELWVHKIEAGNCYVNRGITGAIVQRQPFGGCKESSFGPGMKAGGPNYLVSLMQASQKCLPHEKSPLSPAAETLLKHLSSCRLTEREMNALQTSLHHYAYYWSTYFCKRHDPSCLLGQDNLLSYLPHRQLLLRLNDSDTLFDTLCIIGAAITLDIPLEISGEQRSLNPLFSISCLPQLKITLTPETENDLIRHLSTCQIKRVRMISAPSDTLQVAFAKETCNVTIAKPLANGRLELLHFLQEMSLSSDYHRYGNLGERENEKRKPLPICEITNV